MLLSRSLPLALMYDPQFQLYLYSLKRSNTLKTIATGTSPGIVQLLKSSNFNSDHRGCMNGFQSRDETVVLVHKRIANYG